MINSSYGTLKLLIASSDTIQARENTLTAQAASGNVSDSYGGYSGGDAQTMFDLAPQIAQATTLSSNIDTASSRASVTQTVMTQLQSIATSFYASVQSVGEEGASAMDSLAANARTALQQVAGLLNTQDGSVYVFGGTDTATAPVPAADAITSSSYFDAIQSAVQGLTLNGAAATLASTMTTATATAGVTPFSADLQGYPATAPAIQTSPGGQPATIGLLPTQNTLIPATTGASTTGSYMRDLMRSLATIGSLTGAQVTDPGFAAVMADTQSSLLGVTTGIATEAGALGAVQSTLTAQKTQIGDTSVALQKQVSDVQQVDMASTLSNLQEVQTQLTASFKLIAAMKDLTLASYI